MEPGALPDAMKPGDTAFTVMPSFASSFASERVSMSTPAFAM